ncbi:hypothetical protein K0U83_09635 [bacterium]|nr:hypothetical protein [bacterium]
MSHAATLVISIVQLVLATPELLDVFSRLVGGVSKVKDASPIGFFAGLFDPAKAEENAVALVSAGLDAGQVAVDVGILQLALSTVEAERVGATIAEPAVEAPPYDR